MGGMSEDNSGWKENRRLIGRGWESRESYRTLFVLRHQPLHWNNEANLSWRSFVDKRQAWVWTLEEKHVERWPEAQTDKMFILHKDILMLQPEPLTQVDRARLLESLQTGPCMQLCIPEASASREKSSRAISRATRLVSEMTACKKNTESQNCTAGQASGSNRLSSWSAETVSDPASTDNQDTMSGDPPSDITTKDPFQDMTEQPFTYDYEDATHSQAMDEEEGKQLTWDEAFIQPTTILCRSRWLQAALQVSEALKSKTDLKKRVFTPLLHGPTHALLLGQLCPNSFSLAATVKIWAFIKVVNDK